MPSFLKKISPVVAVGLVLTAACFAVFVSGSPFIQAISNYAYDAFLKRVARPPQSGRVLIVDLDDASLQAVGQWPWPRYLVADLTKKILDAGASVVAFDIVFPERDRTSPAVMKEAMKKRFGLDVDLRGIPEDLADFDGIFAGVLRSGKTILGFHILESNVPAPDDSVPEDPSPTYIVLLGKGDANRYLMQGSGFTLSIPLLAQASRKGFFNAVPGADSIVRSNPLVWALGRARVYPSLALEAVRLDRGVKQCIVDYDETGVQRIRLPPGPAGGPQLVIPADQAGSLMVNYRKLRDEDAKVGFASSFPVFPAKDVLAGKVGRAEMEGKIVFVGTSAVGLKDIKATPLTQYLSGVEVHATMVDNILAGDMLWNPSWMVGIHAVTILLMGGFLTVFIARGRAWLSFVVSAVMIAGSIGAGYVLLRSQHLVFVPAWTCLSVVIIYPVLTMIRYWQEEVQKKQVRNMFGTMVSENVLHFLENNPESFSLSGRRMEATMFFSDVAGFTTISESVEPGKLSDLLNRYLSPMTHIIMARSGYVDKYEGDLIMAVWGVPYEVKDHAAQACLAAIEQQKELSELRPWLRKAFGHDIYVRMGVNTGLVTAGNMGSDRKFQYTVMGDAVNLAARLEPLNKDYGTSIVIGEATWQEAREAVEVRLLDKVIVKGKTIPIQVYELLAAKGDLAPGRQEVIRLYEDALRLHWDRKWDEALGLLRRLLDRDPRDAPAIRLRDVAEAFKIRPPPDAWAGESVRVTKD